MPCCSNSVQESVKICQHYTGIINSKQIIFLLVSIHLITHKTEPKFFAQLRNATQKSLVEISSTAILMIFLWRKLIFLYCAAKTLQIIVGRS